MRTTIDKAGRVVIPLALRERLSLGPGQAIEVRERDGRIEIEPAPLEVALEERDGALVAVPTDPPPPLTDAMVRAVLEQTRR